MSFEQLDPSLIKTHRGKSYVGISTGIAIFNQKGQLFLAKRSLNARDEHGTWDGCGGGLEWGLTLEENMRQEMLEEFNIITNSPLHYVRLKEAFRTDQKGHKTHWLSIGYIVILNDDEVARVKINEPDKFDEMGWFSPDDLPTPLHSLITPELVDLLKVTYQKVTTTN